jgi:hypothetical protein
LLKIDVVIRHRMSSKMSLSQAESHHVTLSHMKWVYLTTGEIPRLSYNHDEKVRNKVTEEQESSCID